MNYPATLVATGETRNYYHFKNAAARAKGLKLVGQPIPDVHALTFLVNNNRIPRNLVKQVPLKLTAYDRSKPAPREPRQSRTVSLVTGKGRRTPTEMAAFVVDMAQMNPQGFRRPSTKSKNVGSTSLVEQVAIAAGQMEPPKQERSARGLKKLEARNDLRAKVKSEQAGYLVDADGKPVLDAKGKRQPYTIDPKYLTAAQRRKQVRRQRELANAA